LLSAAREVALCHHEKWDGTGYPQGLRGMDIPAIGRIVAAADVMDALLSERPYKPAWTVAQTLEYIGGQRSRHFESAVVDALLESFPELMRIRDTYLDD